MGPLDGAEGTVANGSNGESEGDQHRSVLGSMHLYCLDSRTAH